ncbi:MAG: hypothetical protein GU361_05370 [Desulfurococcales archaeon]|nr:hypothetical protein [Desulfurococcales archaeon]
MMKIILMGYQGGTTTRELDHRELCSYHQTPISKPQTDKYFAKIPISLFIRFQRTARPE